MNKLLLVLLAIMTCGFASFSQQTYDIYPVPQKQILNSGKAHLTEQVNIVTEPGIDEVTVSRARQIMDDHGISTTMSEKPVKGVTNILLGVNGSKNIVDDEVNAKGLDRNVFSLPKYDRHIVSLSSDDNGIAQIIVLGENTDAAFYGLATVEQILDSGLADLPCVVIYDYADQRSRGVVEGYYGVPYNAEVTKDLFRYMARYKMNTYMYGAKSDPYHTLYWDKPYPVNITPEQKQIGYLNQEMLSDIVKTAHDSKVNFIWAIHPGNAFIDKDDVVLDRIMDKFQNMYDLGVRQFGVFVDDVGVPYDKDVQLLGAERLTALQKRIEQRWNSDKNALPADTVKPLHYVPQLYAYSWTTPDKARGFFESLSGTPDNIDIYITGAKVWSVPNSTDLKLVKSWLGRDVAWWWNYPCNDNDMTKLFTMDMYTNFRDESHIDNLAKMDPDLKGAVTIIANPMQQGEMSKIGLFSVGDYAWNNSGFNNDRSWEASIASLVGQDKSAALKKVLPYLRYYDTDALAYYVKNYKAAKDKENSSATKVLQKELADVLASCEILEDLANSTSESDRLLYADMRPWLSKLETMINITLDLMAGKDISGYPDIDNDKAFEVEILNGMGEEIVIDAKIAEPSAVVLRPFIEWLKEQNKTTES